MYPPPPPPPPTFPPPGGYPAPPGPPPGAPWAPAPRRRWGWAVAAAGVAALFVVGGVAAAAVRGSDPNREFAKRLCTVERELTVEEAQAWALRVANTAAGSSNTRINPNTVYRLCSDRLGVPTAPGFQGAGEATADVPDDTLASDELEPESPVHLAGPASAAELVAWLNHWVTSRSAADWAAYYEPAIAFYATDTEDLERNTLFSPDDLDGKIEQFAQGRIKPSASTGAVTFTKTSCAQVRAQGWDSVSESIARNYAADPELFPFYGIEAAVEYSVTTVKVLCPTVDFETATSPATAPTTTTTAPPASFGPTGIAACTSQRRSPAVFDADQGQYAAYITAMDGDQVQFDVIQLAIDEPETNENALLRWAPIYGDATIRVFPGSGVGSTMTYVTADDLAEHPLLAIVPFYLTFEGGVVTDICEVFTP